MAGSYKVTPPDLGSCKSYEIFQKELAVWELTTPVPEEKMGAVIASMLPVDIIVEQPQLLALLTQFS